MTLTLLKNRLYGIGYDIHILTPQAKVIQKLLSESNYEYIGSLEHKNMLRVVASSFKGYHYFSVIYPINIKVIGPHMGPAKNEVDLTAMVESDTPRNKRRNSLSKSIKALTANYERSSSTHF